MEKPILFPCNLSSIPQGYSTFVTSAGIKDRSLDVGIVVSEKTASAAALFTQNRIVGNPILVGRKHMKKGKLKAIIVNSKNANVLSGSDGYENTVQLCEFLASKLNCRPEEILPCSTGVIGRPLPVQKILKAIDSLPASLQNPPQFDNFARATMTTDTVPKYTSRKVGNASIVATAKGSGMIEPNMATMLSYFFTDAEIESQILKEMLTRVAEKTFHCLSVDSDTSTSDTVAIMANGMAGKVDLQEFEESLCSMATDLTKMLAYDGEGATKLFQVHIQNAPSFQEARAVGKSIINSPLVKTAIYQGDPNWGRIFMAIGKTGFSFIEADKVKILWGNPPKEYRDTEEELASLSAYLKENAILDLTVDLKAGKEKATVYGCDLTEEYVRINAYYTT
ncbi:MAG: bifunctional glutamate N-acetyltransferase/amino-acid acetyltransferase ArgJ [Candidatus Hydrogenedentota bacterium]|nr:MAG: bifunctional glutamate N-acetyltransferase/amino-acid acetyltransferase ArgJ [Candidatus Hydrogenedentota bacterium]